MPVDLDKHREAADQKATQLRRQRRSEEQSEQAAADQRETDLDNLLLAEPAETWPQAAARATFLISLFAETKEAQEPRYARLIAYTLDDLSRLCVEEQETQ